MKQLKPQYACSLELAMELVGGKWKLVLLWHLQSGAKRFCELKRKLGDITQKMLTLQLRELEGAGLLTRTVYPVVPPHVEYALTERGRALAPVLRDLCAWSGSYAVEKGITLGPLPPSGSGPGSPCMTESLPEA
ncbi:helix-turn-helix domain-containing protein [uncultured Bilophila sp.]|uniref:winged helix-turn-helix transcriptional regulator n=1 Tax=uncultured Bilophila sp. TaxID=529385 RepID=UPI00280B37C3|nr:helix-turn-helix domain-containing protein [uncultured Bilophila sp.]